MSSRPMVYSNMAITADGRITSSARETPAFTSAEDRRRMDARRAEADCLLVGAGSVRSDDPPLHVRDPDMQKRRRELGKPDQLMVVVVTASGNLDEGQWATSPKTGPCIVATTERAASEALNRLPEGVEVLRVGDDGVDFPQLLSILHERGVRRLLLEGGAEINWHFVKDDLIDEMFITLAPTVLGGATAPGMVAGPGLSMDTQLRLELLSVEHVDSELFCHYRRVRPTDS